MKNTVKFHEVQDNWKKPNGVRVFNLVGYNVPTLKMLAENGSVLKFTYTTEGDGTVPLWSAETSDRDEIFYMDLQRFNTNHSEMIGEEAIDAQILNLLQRGKISSVAGFSKKRPDKKLFQETIK